MKYGCYVQIREKHYVKKEQEEPQEKNSKRRKCKNQKEIKKEGNMANKETVKKMEKAALGIRTDLLKLSTRHVIHIGGDLCGGCNDSPLAASDEVRSEESEG